MTLALAYSPSTPAPPLTLASEPTGYAVRLSSREQRLLRAGTDVGRTSARTTLTGPRWTDLLLQLTESAFIADEVADEAGEDDPAPPDGTAYRTLIDAISVELGGPRHPPFG